MTDNPEPQTIDIVPGFAQALDIFATVLTDGTEEGRREARALLLELGRQLDQWAEAGELVRPMAGGRLELVDFLDLLDAAAILWHVAGAMMDQLQKPPAPGAILKDIYRRHGSAAAREFVAGLGIPFHRHWSAIPAEDREPFDLEAETWLAANLEAHAIRSGLWSAGHYDNRNP